MALPAEASSSRPPTKRVAFSRSTKSGKSNSGPLYMQTSGNTVLVRRIKHKNESPTKQFTRWLVNNQTGLSFNLIALLFLTHSLFPKLRSHTSKFFTLSYHNPETGHYNLGKNDFYLVSFLVTFLTGLRASVMEYILAPFAKNRGLSRRKSITRFSEQAWMLIYYAIMFPLGFYIYANSPCFMSLEKIWIDWPNREMNSLLKTYIIIQLAFWFQQIIVINIEERRKDHWQMLTHHFITVSLILTSYRYRHTRVANVILILMDVSDFFLPLAKCLKYLGHTLLCDMVFGCFIVSWFIPRHIFFSMVCYSLWKQSPNIIPQGCYRGGPGGVTVVVGPDEVSPFASTISAFTRFNASTSNQVALMVEGIFDANGSICFNHTVKWSFLSLLLSLEALISVWFVMIVQVAIRVIKGNGAEDSRSDDESDQVEEDEEEEEEEREGEKAKGVVYEEAQAPLEKEVGVEDIDFKGWERRSGVKRPASTTTGVSLPGHSDRKELLGRIGCEKHMD